ncbi:MAG: hypothetical protein V1676_03710 [Candidatus Diapherotrites archaeon]
MAAIVLQSAIMDNIRIVITLIVFVWVFGWAKENTGSAKLAIVFALIVIYLTLWQFPQLVWIMVAMFVLAAFGKDFFAKLNPFQEKGW